MALPQPLHIFRKDLIHLWPETAFVLVLFIGFCALAPSGWTGSQYAVFAALGALLIKILMVVSWLVLIARAIQDESLVGDRQFWTSRPYHWANLLAAKALLIFTCIYVPFFLMQVYLLKHAGLHPMLVLPALFHNLLLLTVVVIIPLAALSAVTSTFPRVLLSFIGALLYILVLLGIVAWVTFLQMQYSHLDWLIDGIFIVLPAAALLLQYKTRKTLISRVILAVTPLLAVIIVFLTPTNSIIARSYPPASGPGAPVLIGISNSFHPDTDTTARLATFRGQVEVALPVAVNGMEKDVNFLVHGIRTTITAPGVAYTSPFMTSPLPFNQRPIPVQFNASRAIALVTFSLPVELFNKIHTSPVDIHLQMAAEQLKADKPSVWHATLLPFSVPGNGICSFNTDEPDAPPTCRYPLKQPEISFVSAPLAAQSCANPAAPPVTGQANVGNGGGATLDFDPVITVPLTFQTGDPDTQHHYVLCPGTELTFVEAITLPNASVTLDQKGVILDPFANRFTERSARPRQPGPPPPSAPQ
jgi:hypothetical protein